MRNCSYIISFLGLVLTACYSSKSSTPAPVSVGLLAQKINGMAVVATPNPYTNNPMIPLKELYVNWISLQPFGFFYKDEAAIQQEGYEWWGESRAGLIETVHLAKAAGIKVMLKPQLWAYNQWIGDLEFEEEEDWEVFEQHYQRFISRFARLADSLEIDLLCIGTEVKQSALQRSEFWRRLIEDLRQIYKGKLIYAANWDNYTQITFWDALDYIGIDAYFPLTNEKCPTVAELKQAWQPTIDSLTSFQTTWKRPILFTEFGYMSLEGCAYKAWLLEQKASSTPIDEQAQANALQALLETFGALDWWQGGFQWKWYPDRTAMLSHDEWQRAYTPQGKKAAKILKMLYQPSRQ